MMSKQRKALKLGDIRYVSGRASSRVKVVGQVDELRVLIEYLTVGPTSRYKVGDQVEMNRRCLYPYGGR